jgi:two-component sensor histidine kinase
VKPHDASRTTDPSDGGGARAREQTRRLELVNQAAQIISSDLDLDRMVQKVTDIATELSGAKFGAFFYNVDDDKGESYLLYALSGAPREAFEHFGLPRNTEVFAPTFAGESIVRSDDIRADPRYGKNAPHHGMPKGHLPVVSYLAMPVISRSGEVLGGLFFAHDEAGKFTQATEELVSGVVAHAAIAFDNARLLQRAEREIARRQRAEEAQQLLLEEVKHRVRNTLATIQAMAAQTFRDAPKQDQATFAARVHALAEALELVTTREWRHAPIGDIVTRAVAPFEEPNRRRFDIGGPAAALGADAVLALGLALHELATNAVKYGALSNEGGRVKITWSLGDGGSPRLYLNWTESGGPMVRPPEKVGFGTTLIERTLGGGGQHAGVKFLPEGVSCAFELPL